MKALALWSAELAIRLAFGLVMYVAILSQLDVNGDSDVANVGAALVAVVIWNSMVQKRNDDG